MLSKQEGEEKDPLQTQIKEVSSKLIIGHFSDTHNYHEDMEWNYNISNIDIVIFSGDLSSVGYRDEVEDFIRWFKKLPAQYRIMVAGNHERTFDPYRGGNDGSKPEWLIELLHEFQQFDTNFYLENDSCEIQGLKFWGSPYSAEFHGDKWAFNVDRGRKSFEMYSKIPTDTDILITHGPPYGKNDWCENIRGPIGCLDLEYHVKRVKPLLHLYGHIHEAYGYLGGYDTHYFNGSICNPAYRPVNHPWIIEIDLNNREIQILNEIL